MHAPFSKLIKSTSVPRDILLTIIGAVLGLTISQLYYMKSVSDMKADAEERKTVDELILRGIENVGAMNYVRDDTGKVIGVKIKLHGSGQVQASGSATLTVTPPVK